MISARTVLLPTRASSLPASRVGQGDPARRAAASVRRRSPEACIPALRSGTAFFDGPGGTQTPEVVADAIRDALLEPLSNRGTVTEAARNADAVVLACRESLGDLLHVEPEAVVLGRSMTALTFDVARALAREWQAGDEVVVTRLDHDADITPWHRAAEGVGATVRQADFDPSTGELPTEAIRAQLSERTRFVAVTAASNLIGTMPDVAGIAAEVHAVGALLFVDGVHYAAHALVDVPALGADLFACSPYKFLGPHCGVLTGRPEVLASLRPEKLVVSSDAVPERFELGTLPYELMAGVTAAVDLIASLVPGDGSRRERLARSIAAVEEHETALRRHLEAGLDGFEQVTRHSRAARRTPTVLVSLADRAEPALSAFLAERGINAPSGHFYAREASRRLGLGDAGGLRIGLAPYTDRDDVDRLLSGFEEWFRGR